VELSKAFSDGVRSEGVAVHRSGDGVHRFPLFPRQGHLNAPGAMFTASHNPARYNGIQNCVFPGPAPSGSTPELAEIQATAESSWDRAHGGSHGALA